jgi:transposase
VRVLGVDDFAFRKSHAYGTILVDLERRRVVDLLPERSTESLARCLREHSGVEIDARNRSHVSAQGVSEGAPGATQVADRWHLLRNLASVLEEFLLQKRPALRREDAPAGEEAGEETRPDAEDVSTPGPMPA